MAQKQSEKKKSYNTTTIVMIIFITILSLLNGYLYFQLSTRTQEYELEYTLLYNRTTTLENYYNNLTDMYSDIRSEYDQLSNSHKELLQEHYNMSAEYNDILNYKKEILLASNEKTSLPIKANTSYTYEIPFSGYIIMNFTATDDIYVWIGSSMVEGIYFSRYPQFPETAEAASFMVPVTPDLHVFIGNPNEFTEARVTFSIKFVY